jgi:hypothetical protein
MLMPQAWQELDVRRDEFWRDIDKLSNDIAKDGVVTARGKLIPSQAELDNRLYRGEIDFRQWDKQRQALRTTFRERFEALANSERYKHVPITMEDIKDEQGNVIREGMISLLTKRGQLVPTLHPAREILNLYYSIDVPERFDPETNSYYLDWDSYYAQLDAIVDTLSQERRDDLVKIITRNMTPLEKLRWQISRDYFRPYYNAANVVLNSRSEEEQRIIKDWLRSPSLLEKRALREKIGEDGARVISDYQTDVTTTRRNLRMLNPQLDAWLLFFQRVASPATPEAEVIYAQHRAEYGLRP